jgi:hypothetical protein
MVVLGCALLGASVANAATTHVFDPVLSLTGNCETNLADPVPDPGCPGGAHPPAGRFNVPRAEAIDEYGNLYVSSSPQVAAGQGVIDVFDANGFFITEIPDKHGPRSIAVDSEGNLYVYRFETGATEGVEEIVAYEPTKYEPATGEIAYGKAPVQIVNEPPGNIGIAVDPSNDHLYVNFESHITEYSSRLTNNTVVDASIGSGSLIHSKFVTVDGRNHDIYASDTSGEDLTSPSVVKVFDGEAPGHPLKRVIDGSCLPGGKFGSLVALTDAAVEESTGHVFVDDRRSVSGAKAVFEFTETGDCVSTIQKNFSYALPSQIAVDNGAKSPNGALNPLGSYLYVPSGESQGESHVYAFEPKHLTPPPAIESTSFDNVTRTEAELEATINPEGAATDYVFELTTQASFLFEGFASATVVGSGTIGTGSAGVSVSAVASGLTPGTAYRFRVRAVNACETAAVCEVEEDRGFTTFGLSPGLGSCPNEAFRTAYSAALPDCRAYELVTPGDTGGRAPHDTAGVAAGDRFGTPTATASGDAVGFSTFGGALPGTEAAGGFNGDPYLATRGLGGWQTKSIGMSGTQSSAPAAGGLSPDLQFGVVSATRGGTLPVEGKSTTYVRSPDGTFHLLGVGSLGEEPFARAAYISAGGEHVIFTTLDTSRQLEPNAPPTGTQAIYDRTPDGVTHVVSLLPGNVPPAPGQDAFLAGSQQNAGGYSFDGTAVAFKLAPTGVTIIDSPLYVRVDNRETLVAAAPGAEFAGFSADGRYLFYLSADDDIARYDTETLSTTSITSSHDATVVNVPADGTSVYFVSPSILTPGESNPRGAQAQAGQENLYLWRNGKTGYVATVTAKDVEGEFTGPGGFQKGGLGLWIEAMGAANQTAVDPSRSTSDGSVLLFESRANLIGYEPGNERAEVYRFNADAATLDCLSCSPTGAPARSDDSLQSLSSVQGPEPVSQYGLIQNLSVSGDRAFFQSYDPLVPSDSDGVQDVYEWEATGTGSCDTPGGCIYLISSGASHSDNYLFGASATGDDVFFSTSDRLLGVDPDSTPSIYDARVGGGFVEPREEDCAGEACRPGLALPPSLPQTASPVSGESGNVKRRAKCPKGKRRVKRKGKVVCVKNRRHRHHKQKRRSHRTGGKSGGAGK